MIRIAILLLMLQSLFLNAAETITIAGDDWMPINGDPKSQTPGFAVEVMKEIFEPLGYKIEYQFMPWSQAVSLCRKGKIDALVGSDEIDSRNLIFPHNAIDSYSDTFYVLKTSKWRYRNLASLEKITLAYAVDYGYDRSLMFYINSKKMSNKLYAFGGEKPLESMIKKMIAGKIDVIPENPAVMAWKLKERKLEDKIVIAGITESWNSIYIAFTKEKKSSKKYADIFDNGFIKLKTQAALIS